MSVIHALPNVFSPEYVMYRKLQKQVSKSRKTIRIK